MKTSKEKCGCVSDARRWVELCPQHKAEADELHARAAKDHRAAMLGWDEEKPRDKKR